MKNSILERFKIVMVILLSVLTFSCAKEEDVPAITEVPINTVDPLIDLKSKIIGVWYPIKIGRIIDGNEVVSDYVGLCSTHSDRFEFKESNVLIDFFARSCGVIPQDQYTFTLQYNNKKESFFTLNNDEANLRYKIISLSSTELKYIRISTGDFYIRVKK
jgi:hypothetical protein